MQAVEYLAVMSVALLVAAFLTMTVEMAFNAVRKIEASPDQYLQTATIGALIAVVGIVLSSMFGRGLYSSCAIWAILPAVFWTIKYLISGGAFVSRFLGAGQRCASGLAKVHSVATSVSSKKDQNNQLDAQAAIAMLERELLARRRGDDDGKTCLK